MVTIDDAYKCLYALDDSFDYTSIKIRLVSSLPFGVIMEGDKPVILFPSDTENIETFKPIFEKTKWYLVYPRDLNKCLEEIKDKDLIIDIETNQLEIFSKTPKIISFGWTIHGTNKAYSIPTEEPFVDSETKEKHIAFVIQLLENCRSYITHNGTMFDLPFLAEVYNLDVFELFKKQKMDVLILAYTLTGGGFQRGEYKLGALVHKFVNNKLDWKTDVQAYLRSTERKVKNRTYDKIPIDLLLPYNRLDVIYTAKLYDVLCSKYHADMKKAVELVHKEVGYLCLKMFEDGLFLDYNTIAYLNERITEKKKESDALAKYFLGKIYDKRQMEINVDAVNFNSNKQTAKIYYKDMGLPVLKTSVKTDAPSVDNPSLSLLLPFEPSLLLSQLLSEKWSTYGGYLKGYVKIAGRSIFSEGLLCCHSHFSPTGTVTGRLASSLPNAQNITNEAQLKSAFCCPDRSKYIFEIRKKMEEFREKK
jgi:DNA polymerase I-like protein with 3'-5' exonuclease and polymerase domains